MGRQVFDGGSRAWRRGPAASIAIPLFGIPPAPALLGRQFAPFLAQAHALFGRQALESLAGFEQALLLLWRQGFELPPPLLDAELLRRGGACAIPATVVPIFVRLIATSVPVVVTSLLVMPMADARISATVLAIAEFEGAG